MIIKSPLEIKQMFNMRRLLVSLVILIFIFGSSFFGSQPQIISVTKVWDEGEHSAFTDLIRFQEAFYLAFREGNSHDGSIGQVRILKSCDGNQWETSAVLRKPGVDLRDPKLSIRPDGSLMLLMGGALLEKDSFYPQVAFSLDGCNWSQVQSVNLPNEWIWSLTWHGGIGYTFGYKGDSITLYKTDNGLAYDKITKLTFEKTPTEATIRFFGDEMIALLRRHGEGLIGHSKPPYTDWEWSAIPWLLGGPNFLIFPDGSMWASSRLYKGYEALTAFGKMTLDSYHPEYLLPSGGDTGYPGMVLFNGKLYISYYSSHEGKSAIYLAKIKLY